MTPEKKAVLEQKLLDTDYSQLPDVVERLQEESLQLFKSYRRIIRDELIEATDTLAINDIPEPPTARWSNK
jgi:hypothetical protein